MNRPVIAARMSEAELEEHVRQYCRDLGVIRFHVHDSRGMTPGFPDDVLIGRRGLLWRELKSQGGQLSPEQHNVRQALKSAGQDWALWRPADLVSGEILRQLMAIV